MTPGAIATAALGLTAVVWDLRSATIPNWLSAGGVAAGLGCELWSGGLAGLALAAAGALAGFAVFSLAHCMGGMGAGDLKLMAAFGALLGPSGILMAAVLAAIAGALLAAAVSLLRPGRPSIPYAPPIVLGAWLVLLGRS